MSFDATRKYDLILADPPWEFKTYSKKGEKKTPQRHYRTLRPRDIQQLRYADLAEKDSVLLLWCTYPHLEYGMEAICGAGFQFKTVAFTWVKATERIQAASNVRKNLTEGHPSVLLSADNLTAQDLVNTKVRTFPIGGGFYTRANPELVLLGTRGKGLPRLSRSVRNLLIAPVGEHSAKPLEQYNRITELFGTPDQIACAELFARRVQPGWQATGYDLDGRDIYDVLREARLHKAGFKQPVLDL